MDGLFNVLGGALSVLSESSLYSVPLTGWLVIMSLFTVIGLFIHGKR